MVHQTQHIVTCDPEGQPWQGYYAMTSLILGYMVLLKEIIMEHIWMPFVCVHVLSVPLCSWTNIWLLTNVRRGLVMWSCDLDMWPLTFSDHFCHAWTFHLIIGLHVCFITTTSITWFCFVTNVTKFDSKDWSIHKCLSFAFHMMVAQHMNRTKLWIRTWLKVLMPIMGTNGSRSFISYQLILQSHIPQV